jgi:hypothetical protein
LHASDIGGEGSLSEAQRSLIRRAATIETELERFEGQLAIGHSVDIDAYGRSAGQLRRILESLGLKRAQREIRLNPIVEHFKLPPVREAAE